MEFLADTTFLIGLWRKKKACLDFATEHSSCLLFSSWISEGEFLQGALFADHDLDEVHRFLGQFQSAALTSETIRHYAEIGAVMQKEGLYREVGQNDIWQAALARELNLTLITGNERHFTQMPEVKIIVPGSEA